MILFFDGVSHTSYIALYNPERKKLASQNFEIAGNESSQTLAWITKFLKSENISFSDISDIVCVTGPGSFTGIRTISLVINSFVYIYPHIKLTPLNYFDLYNSYPIVKASSRRDLFVKYEKDAIIEVIANMDFEKNLDEGTCVYGDINAERFEKNFLIDSYIDYDKIVASCSLLKLKRIAPNYIKKPNIS